MDKRPLVAALITLGVAAALMALPQDDDAPAPRAPRGEPTAAPTATGGKVRPMIASPTTTMTSTTAAEPLPTPDAASRALPPVAAAIADFAARERVDPASVSLRRLQRVTWPDGSLGCPKPGMMYTQALVDGYWLELAGGPQAAPVLAEYHTDLAGQAVACPSGPPANSATGSTE